MQQRTRRVVIAKDDDLSIGLQHETTQSVDAAKRDQRLGQRLGMTFRLLLESGERQRERWKNSGRRMCAYRECCMRAWYIRRR